MIEFLKRENAPDLAYIRSISKNSAQKRPTVMFLGGFRSDMEGTKATFLEAVCQKRDQNFIRFDYRGHGKSGGKFEEACISDWLQDALDIIEACTSGPVLMVGSSMGGWISLLTALQKPERVHAIIGLAAAPNFTQWMEEGMSADQKEELSEKGYFELPNDYDDTPYIITQKLLEDGRKHGLLGGDIAIHCPVRLIQGKKDADVPWKVAEQIKQAITGDDVEITYIEEADHRLSAPDELEILKLVLVELSDQ